MAGDFLHIIILTGISLVLYYFTTKTTLKNSLLLLTSLLFYYMLEGEKIAILAIIILISFFTGKLLHTTNYKKYILFSGIAINVLLLLSHKYILSIYPYHKPSLPIGLSFYTFQSISYIIDMCRKKDGASYSFVETATFIAFFPKLLAGPLERIDSFIHELKKTHSYNKKRTFTAFKIILYALTCKFVFADKIGMYVDGSLSDYSSLSAINILITAALFSFQIFFDFYAYSILAIGIARLYGIKLSYNFNYPYFSTSLYDFWKRWNITLTFWFRDYIYIPLGGNRVSTLRWAVNVMIVFIISGIWHGATFNFLLWGFFHGLLYITERYVYRRLPVYYKQNSLLKCLYSCIVFVLLSLLWLLFRADNHLMLSTLSGQLLSDWRWGVTSAMILWLIASMSIILIFRKYRLSEKYIFQTKENFSFIGKEICLINAMIILLFSFSASGNSSFIYFKF